MNRRTARLIATALALGGLTVTAACNSSAPGTDKSSSGVGAPRQAAPQSVQLGSAAESSGADPAVPGAKSGGTVTVLQRTDFSHLDPARVYSSGNQTADLLLTRQLTSYQQIGGTTRLVGDLATDTGTAGDGGRTWTFHLKDGIAWQDGTPITAQDVKYGIERTFQSELTGGPTYLQTWITGKSEFNQVYGGPWGGKELSAIETPDARTVVIHLAQPHADLPFAMAMQAYSPVSKAHDTRKSYDQNPFSSGPYRIRSHDIGKSMTLVRNTHWNPDSDPTRHAYPDQWSFSFGGQSLDIDQRLIAANGSDRTAMTFNVAVTADVAQQVVGTPAVAARTVNQVSPFTEFFSINNRRVTDPEVRQALLLAFPRQQVRTILGGPLYGDLTNTYMSAVTNGYQKYDLFHATPGGDPEAAKKLLAEAGNPHPTIVFAYSNTAVWQQAAVAVADGLSKAGFNVVKHEVSDQDYYDETGAVDNKFDVYWAGWGPDWPSADTMIPPVFDGRIINPGGGNTMLYDNGPVNAEIDRITAETDLAQQDKDWAALEQKIMKDVPIIPFVDKRQVSVYGPGLGGVHLGFIGTVYPLDVYVK